ncbi:flagellar biosynthesis regulator FlaF [Rhodoplanes roseus]|uniref:Flagellar protein FlaF n=1 Tax=Rhodoplanes roseus TaxID=29409 RepID=A0A327L3D2_9BRAD|nr:flagellar biosynthesis regulator FlaF [Rhodoplanes roseus]RAI44897.1 hypothetical protein CH341_06700 [Rhodoplanes roseus]
MQDAATASSPEHRKLAPRDVQAHLLLEAASRLQAVQSGWSDSRNEIAEALSHNRRLWDDLLVSACDCPPALPSQVRQCIASLGLYVAHQTTAIAADPQPDRLTPLIGLNRDIAAGLLGQT